MKILSAILAACMLLMTMPAQAQTQNTDIIPNFNVETLEPILTQLGYTYERRTLNNGTTVLLTQRNGRNVAMGPRACDNNQCRGLLLLAPLNSSATAAEMNDFNRKAFYSAASVDTQGRLSITRYLIGDYGTVAGSFAVNLNVFEISISEWFKLKNPTTNQISFEPLDPDGDLALTTTQDPLAIEIMASLSADGFNFNAPLASDLLQPGGSHDVASGLEQLSGE